MQILLTTTLRNIRNTSIAAEEFDYPPRVTSPSSLEPHGANGQPAVCHSPRVAPSKRPNGICYVGDPKPSNEKCMASSSDSSVNESGYVVARPPYLRTTFMIGPEPKRTIDLTLPDPHHCHAPGKCPMWLPTESLSTKSDARTPSTNKKDHRSDATS
ncbi:hypothetical protein L1987_20426 [Smallanthus sonchifolius]|uniref:Uncharacterized protein n=1 Tax=Smallanthus sonchifolius TaxID=185202 RepID=A0ACB9IRB0_9ASTR|nr:hypothetical protein L1987_20426 [Smallanthus sonchifolius]